MARLEMDSGEDAIIKVLDNEDYSDMSPGEAYILLETYGNKSDLILYSEEVVRLRDFLNNIIERVTDEARTS